MISRRPNAETLFDDLPVGAEEHFRIYLSGAALYLMRGVAALLGGFDAAVQRFPFLAAYHRELSRRHQSTSANEAIRLWCVAIEKWEQRAGVHLPLNALRQAAGLSVSTLCQMLIIGLPEEDSNFGELFETLHGNDSNHRARFGFLRSVWDRGEFDSNHDAFARCLSLGFPQIANPESPRPEWLLQIPAAIWDAMRGVPGPNEDWLEFHRSEDCPLLPQLILADETRAVAAALPSLINSGEAGGIIVRGPAHNGRRRLLRAIARAMSKHVLEVNAEKKFDDALWKRLASVALLKNSFVVVAANLGPDETLKLPKSWLSAIPLGVVAGESDNVAGVTEHNMVTVHLPIPNLAARRNHWAIHLLEPCGDTADQFAKLLRLPAGNIHRIARLAQTRAKLRSAPAFSTVDVIEASRSLQAQSFESLARRVPVPKSEDSFVATSRTWRELDDLEERCRHRERLADSFDHAPGGLSCGVRALFTGPTGTGKTLAARRFACRLQKDLYQVDLASTVNKYIGETEKNLNRIFDRAEELDVILLLDEGDALLTRRTDVQTSVDRYANLQTNFLLQRLESYQGILIITTNARDRIDSAFERRMDVVVDFFLPDAQERLNLWQAHFPPGVRLHEEFLMEVATRCKFTGGQIRNIALHAAVLALADDGEIRAAHVESAIHREYLKQGSVCPLR
jgi:hypothetical protein